MRKLEITINLDAITPDSTDRLECVEALRRTVHAVQSGSDERWYRIHDSAGNDIGGWKLGDFESPAKEPRAEYWSDVRGVVEDIKQVIADKEVSNGDELNDWLHDTIDGHSRVIYTHAAMECIMYSDNDGAYSDEFGPEGMVEDGCIMWSRLAYAAFMADVQAQLSAENIDLNANSFDAEEVDQA